MEVTQLLNIWNENKYLSKKYVLHPTFLKLYSLVITFLEASSLSRIRPVTHWLTDTGDKEDTGDTGNTGNTGDTDDTGDTSDTGDTGDTGYIWYTDYTGYIGYTHYTGYTLYRWFLKCWLPIKQT